jgi:hypothetical protein
MIVGSKKHMLSMLLLYLAILSLFCLFSQAKISYNIVEVLALCIHDLHLFDSVC